MTRMRHKILLMYITVRSGHYQAARAVEQAIHRVQPQAEILTIDAFQYLNPVLARIVDRMYLSVIQKIPDLWEYLYDSPHVVQRSERFRKLLHQYDSPRLKSLLEEFQPDAVACTQAFPCGLVADYKEANGLKIPLYGVLTDFWPHAYWVHKQVDGYLVPAEQTKHWLTNREVSQDKIHVTGIPIDPAFAATPDPALLHLRFQMNNGIPVLLLMGGGQGLGPLLESVDLLDRVNRRFQLMVVAGSNESLYHRLITRAPRMKHPMQVFGHVDFVADLMSVATLIVTKTGGLTTSEALAKGLPILALNPIPGQETSNARFLVNAGAACLAKNLADLPMLLDHLLGSPEELRTMAQNSRRLGHARSADEAARLILAG